MNEEERLAKVRRMAELKAERWSLFDITPEEISKEPRLLKDFVLLRNKNNDEWISLWNELYPEPPKDLFEDIKKRQKAFNLAKERLGNRIPPLTLKQKIGLLFKKN